MKILGIALRKETGMGLVFWDSITKEILMHDVVMYDGNPMSIIKAWTALSDVIVVNDVELFQDTSDSAFYGEVLLNFVPGHNVRSVLEIQIASEPEPSEQWLSPAENSALRLVRYWANTHKSEEI